jgi:hypothetical protein
MKNLAVRNMYNGDLIMVPENDPNRFFKWVVILLIVFLIIKILIKF